MAKILGLDLGTNSVGWAVVETSDNKDFRLLKKGVRIFSEANTAKDRTAKRGIRRLYFRRRLRKIETLKILSEFGYCPTISTEELNNWRKYKKYPIENKDLINWLSTDNFGSKEERKQQIKNPYYYRFKAVKQPISKYEVGRAIYHLAQRRGFLSNSLSQESDELIVLFTNKIKEKIEELENNDFIKNEIIEIIDGIDEEFAKDPKVKKLIKQIKNLEGENFVSDVEKLINKRENLGVVKAGIEQLSKEIQISGHKYLGEYLYFLYQSHGNIVNNKQAIELYNDFIERFKKENDSQAKLTNKIRTRYIGRKAHYLQEFEQICKVQGLNEIKAKNGKTTLTEELRKALFYVRPLKSQRGAVGKCKMEKNKPRCPLSHPTYEEFRMWQFINNIKYRNKRKEESQFEHLSYHDKMKIVPLFFRVSNFKFNEIIAKIDPSLETYEFSHQKHFEEKSKDSLTVETCPTIARLVNIFRHIGNWEDIKQTTFKYRATDRDGNPKDDSDGNPVESEIDIYEVWQILYRSKLTRNKENHLKQFAKEKLGLTNDKKASDFQNLANRLKEGYARLSLNAIKKILKYMIPQDEYSPGHIYSHAVFFANMKSIVGEGIWQYNKEKIIADIIQKLDLQQKVNDKNKFLNSLVRDFFNQPEEDRHFPYDNYKLDSSEKKMIESKAIEYVGSYTWKESPEDFTKEFLSYAEDEYQSFLRNVKINGNKSEYFKSISRKDTIIKHYIKTSYLDKLSVEELRDNLKIKNFKLSKEEIIDRQLEKLYHPSEIYLYPKSKVILDYDGKEKLVMPSPYLPDIKNPVANRTLHKLKGLIEYLANNNIIDERTNVHIEVAKEVNGANMRKAITQFQLDRQHENEKYRKLLEEFEKPINIDTTEKVTLWRDQLEDETIFSEDLKDFIKLKDSKKLDDTQKKELNILKRRLWEEQKGICLYSGESISMSQLFQDGVVEIEHTFPRSRIPDNSLQNKTITLRKENQEKGNRIPYELGPEKYAEIKGRLYFWKNKLDALRNEYQKLEKKVSQDLFSKKDGIGILDK
jgi:CRISPR-associated endonuclease Csn1